RARRDFSHGCIRLERAQDLAEWVLREESGWQQDRIVAAMQGTESISVKLTSPIPVMTIYVSAVVAENGEVRFFEDLYGKDAAVAPDSERVAKLLAEAKTLAFQLKDDAVAMEGFTRMNVSWESHAVAINQIREHVNALEKQEAKLKEARAEAAPWQKTAIDRIVPYLDELEGYTSAIVERLTDQPKRLSTDEYKDFLAANADYATD